jgi:geranylgeranyl diphosphate synthase type I
MEDLGARIDEAVATFLTARVAQLTAVSPDLADLATTSREFLIGGKRLRPILAWWGWRAAGGADLDEAIAACASLEFIQACALVHDDVMDDSDTRRGKPSVHKQFAGLHSAHLWQGDDVAYGRAGAILLGDLYLSWADELFFESGLPPEQLLAAKPIYDVMRVELMAGQFLDITSQAMSISSTRRALLVARYKSAKYTVERPLQLGAALAGAQPALIEGLAKFGLPLGEAFQLRDDILGVFGDPAVTGKPAGDDIREGKQTYLIAATRETCSRAQCAAIDAALGRPDLSDTDLAQVRAAIVDSGALQRTEDRISSQHALALRTLAELAINDESHTALAELAGVLVDRSA